VSPSIKPIQVQLGADDYSRYFSVVGKRQSTWANVSIYVAAFCMAIPVAFAARALADIETGNPQAIELAGLVGLLAFFAGIISLAVAASLIRRRTMTGMLAATPHAFDVKTVTLDETGVSIEGKLSQVTWSWPAITRLSVEQGLVLLWIGAQNAVVIPERAFADAGARDGAVAFVRAKLTQAVR